MSISTFKLERIMKMELYSARNGFRKTRPKTEKISPEVYSLLLGCCNQYKNNLIHMFSEEEHHVFTNRDYTGFDEGNFETRLIVLIPTLLRDDSGKFRAPIASESYDQYAILDLIEFFSENIKDITINWNNQYKDYQIIDTCESSNVFVDFQRDINELFVESGVLYTLTNKKIIERIVENSPLSKEVEQNIEAIKEEGTKELLADAIALYKTPNKKNRPLAVQQLWGAFERLKTYYSSNKVKSAERIVQDMAGENDDFNTLFNAEFKQLTDIGNKYRIRHQETDQTDITDSKYYDYLFNRCLSLIALAIQYLE